MVKHILTILGIVFNLTLKAQLQVNPQIGINLEKLGNISDNQTFEGNVGFSFGSDFRFGDRFQLIPGLHYLTTESVYTNRTSTLVQTSNLKNHYIKFRLLGGFNIVDNDYFKLRVNLGPSYDFLVSDKSSPLGNINEGDFILQGGIGADILFFSLDVSYLKSISDKFSLQSGLKAKGVNLSLGIVF